MDYESAHLVWSSFLATLGLCIIAIAIRDQRRESRAKRELAALPPPEPVKPPEPLIFVVHHFIQYSHFFNKDEPWLVQRLDFTKGFYVATKEQALELMSKAEAYREATK